MCLLQNCILQQLSSRGFDFGVEDISTHHDDDSYFQLVTTCKGNNRSLWVIQIPYVYDNMVYGFLDENSSATTVEVPSKTINSP